MTKASVPEPGVSGSAIDPLAQEMMTLAGIAYGDPTKIPSYLADPSLATGGRWRIAGCRPTPTSR